MPSFHPSLFRWLVLAALPLAFAGCGKPLPMTPAKDARAALTPQALEGEWKGAEGCPLFTAGPDSYFRYRTLVFSRGDLTRTEGGFTDPSCTVADPAHPTQAKDYTVAFGSLIDATLVSSDVDGNLTETPIQALDINAVEKRTQVAVRMIVAFDAEGNLRLAEGDGINAPRSFDANPFPYIRVR